MLLPYFLKLFDSILPIVTIILSFIFKGDQMKRKLQETENTLEQVEAELREFLEVGFYLQITMFRKS